MSEEKKYEIADKADMIVGGYAFLKKNNNNIMIVNLNQTEAHVMIINQNDKVIESSMDSIEQVIALKKWHENKEFMEEEDA